MSLPLPPALGLGQKPCASEGCGGQAGSGSVYLTLWPSCLKKPDGGVWGREVVMHPFNIQSVCSGLESKAGA